MTPEEIAFVAGVVKPRSGQVLGPEKGYFVQSRLGPVARREGLNSVPELLRALAERREERLAGAVTEALTNGETMFFRDRAPFVTFRDEVLPKLAAARQGGAIRVWCAGCSTGQEPYSLALLMEAQRERYEGVRLDILATDLSARAIEVAQAGLYNPFEVQRGLPIRMLLSHFAKVEDNWRLASRVRRMVEFKVANLLDDAGLGGFDIVLCRYVLDGFEAGTRAAVLERLTRALAPGGILLLGVGDAAAGGGELVAAGGRPGYYVKPGVRRAAA